MALTATATPKVIQDIRTNLKLDDSVPLHVGCFDRPNIFYKVRYKDALVQNKNPLQDLTAFVEEQHSSSTSSTTNNNAVSGIIYVHKREDTQMIARYLSQHTSLTAAAYHAGLSKAVRASVLEGWSSSKIDIAVATVAFGMGIDVAHVRYVVHWNVPKTMEGLYQESGRAGRDGLPAISLVYYAQDDVDRFRYLLTLQQQQRNQGKGNGKTSTTTSSNRALEALQEIVQYCLDPSCRRKRLVQHFGGTAIQVDCGKTCDYCYNPKKVERAIQSAMVSSSSSSSQQNQKKQQASWDGQWSKPHGDDSGLLLMDDDDENEWGDNHYNEDGDFVNGLQITGPLSASSTSDTTNYFGASSSSSKTNKKTKQAPAGFVKASSILDKYEAMECKSGGGGGSSSGFVHFKAKTQRTKHGGADTTSSGEAGTSSRSVPIVIPEHLRASAPDPLQHYETKKNSTTRTSAQVAASIAEKKKDLAKTRQELQDRLKALQAEKKMTKKKGGGDKNSASSMVPTPPPPTFGGSKKQQR